MAPPTLVPDKGTLTRWIQTEGLTHQECADRLLEEEGIRVTRTAISAAAVRYGLAKEGSRYREELPWRVKALHTKSYPARMLRLFGRRREGQELNEAEASALDKWLEALAESRSIVAYDPESDAGFVYIDKKFKDNRGAAPIRRKTITINE